MELSDSETIDILDVRYFGPKDTGSILPQTFYEFSDL